MSRLRVFITSFDASAERLFDRFRALRGANSAAAVLSNLADHGFIWAVVAAAKGRRPGAARRRAIRALALAGVLSFGINTAVKLAVERRRPEIAQPAGPVPVRSPSSSSFPSGHTLAAFCAAGLLAEQKREQAAFLTFATLVAGSRVLLKAHHASDVLGGALIGTAVGLAARPLLGVGRPRFAEGGLSLGGTDVAVRESQRTGSG